VLRLKAKSSLSGVVRGANGRPPAIPAVVHTDLHTAVTDATGRFRVDNLAPGRHTVRVLLVNGQDPDRMATLTREVTLAPGESARLDAELGSASLRVAVPGASDGELLLTSDPTEARAEKGWAFAQGASLEEDAATFHGLSPGRYLVGFFGPDPRLAGNTRQAIVVVAGEGETRVTLAAPPQGPPPGEGHR
jgi:hypothetical protein